MKRACQIAVLFAFGLYLSACAALPWVPAQVKTTGLPFFTQWSMENGSHLSLEGPSQVQPGEDISYTLRMNNNSPSVWQGKYCLVLQSRKGPITQFAGDSFNLQPGNQIDQVLTAHFSKDLPPDAYGLALILPGSMASITYIHVGNTDQVPGANWPEPRCLQ